MCSNRLGSVVSWMRLLHFKPKMIMIVDRETSKNSEGLPGWDHSSWIMDRPTSTHASQRLVASFELYMLDFDSLLQLTEHLSLQVMQFFLRYTDFPTILYHTIKIFWNDKLPSQTNPTSPKVWISPARSNFWYLAKDHDPWPLGWLWT